jgi:hypothetical protein
VIADIVAIDRRVTHVHGVPRNITEDNELTESLFGSVF